jgi:hypothetical protein
MATTFLSKKNNAGGTLASDMAIDANTLTLDSGQGAIFPASNFHVSIVDEIMLCSSRDGDVLTVTRGVDGTAAAAHTTADSVQLRITKGSLDEYENAINALEVLIGNHPSATDVHGATGAIVGTTNTQTLTNKILGTGCSLGAAIMGLIYPVGCIYTTTVATNPNTIFGFGTWTEFGQGRVLVSHAASGTFNTAGATGGAETVDIAHTHNIGHTHGLVDYTNGGAYKTVPNSNLPTTQSGAMSANGTPSILQPYIVVYIWNRTA